MCALQGTTLLQRQDHSQVQVQVLSGYLLSSLTPWQWNSFLHRSLQMSSQIKPLQLTASA